MRFVSLLLCLAVLLAGCDGSGKNTKRERSLEERLDAALAITDANVRGSTLTVVAKDAAEAGNAEVVKKAVAGIPDTKVLDRAAQNCARKLADKGHHEAANEVAKMISDQKLRDNVLRILAAKR